MNDDINSNNEEDIPECPICMEFYTTVGNTRPKALKCGHSLCGKCFDKLKRAECPICRNPIPKYVPFHTEMIAFLKIIHKNNDRKISNDEIYRQKARELEILRKKMEGEKIGREKMEGEKIRKLQAIRGVAKYQKDEE